MKLSRNPFFYLSLVLLLVAGFQIVQWVGAASYTEPTEGFSGGNPPAPLDATTENQTTTGSLIFPGIAENQNLKIGGGVVTIGNNVAIFAKNSVGRPREAFLPLDGSDNTTLYIGSGGNLYINSAANGSQALAINSGASPSTSLVAGFNLDFSGSVNARNFCFSGDCKSSWAAVVGSGTVSSQWTTVGSDIRYSNGNVIVDKYFMEDQGSYPDGLTEAKAVCIDHYPGLIYERPVGGTIAKLYVSGTDPGGTWGTRCGGDPGPGGFNDGKVLFLSWDWNDTADASATVTLSDTNNRFLFATFYDRNTPGYTARRSTIAAYPGDLGQTPPYPEEVLSIKWSKPDKPSYKRAYRDGSVGVSSAVEVAGGSFLRLKNVKPLPPCPGRANVNVGLIGFQNDRLQVCGEYVGTDGSTLIGWHGL